MPVIIIINQIQSTSNNTRIPIPFLDFVEGRSDVVFLKSAKEHDRGSEYNRTLW